MSQKISNEELLAELEQVSIKLGRTPKQSDLSGNSKYSANAYKRAFGGITKALLLLGKKPTFIRNQTKEDLVKTIKEAYKKINKIPTTKDIDELCSMSYVTALKIMKENNVTFSSILLEAGIPQSEVDFMYKRNITEQELKDEIIRLKNILGRYPTYYDMAREGKYSAMTYETRYGTWINAMKALGFADYISQSCYKNQMHVTGDDGNVYRSNFEARIANLLLKYKNLGTIENYEYEKVVTFDKKWTCDFFIILPNGKEIWLELDGMGENRICSYEDDSNEKIQYYKNNNYNYVILKYKTTNLAADLFYIVNDKNIASNMTKIENKTAHDIHQMPDLVNPQSKIIPQKNEQIVLKVKHLNEQYFTNITTPEQAYCLGFFLMRASVQSNSNEIGISLTKENDNKLLYVISDIIYNENRVKEYKTGANKTAYRLAFYSNELKAGLAKHGCTSNIEFSTPYPKYIHEDLQPAILRGIFDACGNIYISKDKRRIVFSGNKTLHDGIIWAVNDLLKQNILFSSNHNPKKHKENIQELSINKTDNVIKFLKLIYSIDIGNLYLERKFEACQALLKQT